MKKIFQAVLLFVLPIFIFSCGGDENGSYPVEKKYWTADDYNTVNGNLVAAKFNNKELPNLDNPKTAAIFNKIVDTNNISVVMNDNQLGITHRSKFASDMFKEYKDLTSNYSGIDRTDKYQYPVEFAEIIKFGLYFQPYYIGAGNEKITKDADDPTAPDVVSVLNSNKNILINNYDIYLDYINYEDRFTEKAIAVYAEGLSVFFPKLINELAPEGDYAEMSGKIDNMLKKAKSPQVLAALTTIKDLLAARVKK
jgi:hypothetical protein